MSRCARKRSSTTSVTDGKSQVTVEYDGAAGARGGGDHLRPAQQPGQIRDHPRGHPGEGHPRGDPPQLLRTPRRSTSSTPRAVCGGRAAGRLRVSRPTIIVDTYGGVWQPRRRRLLAARPTKVDPLGLLHGPHIARQTWPRAWRPLELQIAYASGSGAGLRHGGHRGTGKWTRPGSPTPCARSFPSRPGIIEYLNLRRPIYKKTAAYGHFGRNEDEFTWERVEKVEALRGLVRR